jgi:hypothetical protein
MPILPGAEVSASGPGGEECVFWIRSNVVVLNN